MNKMDKNIPLKSHDLGEICNENIADYGYKNELMGEEKEEETHRTNIRRQRDKILYTGGFRRLQDKTQVMSSTISGDHRTRLTHTLEVEQIAVSIANSLRLNVDLVSAIALGHDVGHTPFGHAAERKLNELLKNNGGFHHPIQSVRYIWEKYGSKIETKIYEGILLHDSDMFTIDKETADKQLNYLKNKENAHFKSCFNKFPSTLEAQVVIWADKIAYITHDLEDFLRSSIYVNLQKNDDKIEGKLCKILDGMVAYEQKSKYKQITTLKDFELRNLIRNIISNLIDSSAKNINEIKSLKQENVQEKTEERSENYKNKDKNKDKEGRKEYLDSLIINFGDEYRKKYYELRKFLDEYYILSPEVQKSDAKAQIIVEWLFKTLKANYKLMPLNIRTEINRIIICEIQKDKCLKEIYNKLPEEEKSVTHFEKALKNNKKDNEVEEKYNKIKEKIISRMVATYIATMSDTYAEGMYRNLIGSKVDIIL